MQIMFNNDEPVREVEQYKPCPVMIHQWGKWSSTNHSQWGWTGEAWRESAQTMPSNEEPMKHEVKQYKPCPVMMH